jgi:hypothetical protein
MHNRKILIKRIIERDPKTNKLVFNQGIFGALRHDGTRELLYVVEGTRLDAVQMLAAGRTESGNTFKGYKKQKVRA